MRSALRSARRPPSTMAAAPSAKEMEFGSHVCPESVSPKDLIISGWE